MGMSIMTTMPHSDAWMRATVRATTMMPTTRSTARSGAGRVTGLTERTGTGRPRASAVGIGALMTEGSLRGPGRDGAARRRAGVVAGGEPQRGDPLPPGTINWYLDGVLAATGGRIFNVPRTATIVTVAVGSPGVLVAGDTIAALSTQCAAPPCP